MSDFNIHTVQSAPAESTEALARAKKKYGFQPNLLGIFAEAPTALKAYLQLGDLFEQTSFTPIEQQVVILAVSFENQCDYCMAAHSTVAKMVGASPELVTALRQGQPLKDSRLEALRRFSRSLVQQRGWVSENEVSEFLTAGFTKAQVLEVVLGVAYKTLSNYSNHIAGTPLDAPFRSEAWTHPGVGAASASRQ